MKIEFSVEFEKIPRGLTLNSSAGLHAVLVGEEVVPVATAASVEERNANVPLGVIRVPLVLAPARSRFGSLRADLPSGEHVKQTVGLLRAGSLLVQLHPLGALFLQLWANQEQTGADFDTLAAGGAARTPVTPGGYGAHGVGDLDVG